MSDTTGKLIRLLEDLKTLTEQGKVAWNETADEDEFRVALKPGLLRISRGTNYSDDGDEARFYLVTVLNREAKVVEEFSRSSASEGIEFELMRDLYELARRAALRGDNLLDDMLTDVESRMVQPRT
jgi:hypothetical protein